MIDAFSRNITYLRVSVTDRCNLRCYYCKPDGNADFRPLMSVDEIVAAVEAASLCGITKVRLTGGEPLLREDLPDICSRISRLPRIDEVCLTTNAVLLETKAKILREAGIDRINVSLDTLNPETFRNMTQGGDLSSVLRGLTAAKAAGFAETKLNTVIIRGFNEREVPDLIRFAAKEDLQLRLIEWMPIGVLAKSDLSPYVDLTALVEADADFVFKGNKGVARMYQNRETGQEIGVISPLSRRFCSACNRIRLTADGMLKSCLHSNTELSVHGLTGDALIEAFRQVIQAKPERHYLKEKGISDSVRGMSEIGG